MPFTHTFFADLKSALLRRLNDASAVFWTNTGTFKEIELYLHESMRTWGALTGFWRDRATFPTIANQLFYDLPLVLTPAHRAYTLKDQDLVAILQYHLLEPLNVTGYSGTEMFSAQIIQDAIQRRLNQFLSETGVVLTETSKVVSGGGNGRVPLPDQTIDVRRAAWKTAAVPGPSVRSIVWREDEWGLNAFSPNWNISPATPSVFSVLAPPPVTLQLAAPPITSGTLEMLVVQTGTPIDPSTGVLLNIPDDLAWVVKWGALADLLGREGQSRDPSRADYCESRWRQGVEIARLYTSVVQVEINGVAARVDSLFDLDTNVPGWMSAAPAKPNIVAMAGMNLVGLSPVPDAIYSITADVVRNAPVPVAEGDSVELGREELDVILDYAVHLASFKQGGAEFAATISHYERMFRQAAIYNDKLRAVSNFLETEGDRAVRETRHRLRRESDAFLDPALMAQGGDRQ